MIKRIFKYPLVITDVQELLLPVGAEILTVQTQGKTACLWALVDPNGEKENRIIEIFGTGLPVGYNKGFSRRYISTFQMKGGELVFHAFEYTGE